MTLLKCFLLTGALLGTSPAAAQNSAPAPSFKTAQDVEAWKEKNRNWNRWGPEDQLGAVNLITPAKRKEAARLVREGVSISLAHPLETQKAADVSSPLGHKMLFTGESPESLYSADALSLEFHGFTHTHLDALCHVFDHGKMYNGYEQKLVTANGCAKLAVTTLKDGILTRGVLIDIPALQGVPYLEPGTPIHAKDLEAWEKKTKVRVSSGDAVIVRTGRWARRAAVGPWDVSQHSAGLHASTADWFKKRGVALVATDTGLDVLPSGVENDPFPTHVMLINALGISVLDNADTEALSKAIAERKRYDFLLSIAPLIVEGGTGSPVNPIAVF
ncbi:cyclase family protein [Stigmatella aurantiaca]|uniref:Cyclase n=1 Tax=Stigmatella aurantiaca (strain DW4/3-1) TaxID=378806 RepID=Q09ED8_STIAD|nr:cyclase family protein [Stigmatella aurantiaca]ADO74650.1 Cyclase [Stigmatella aurantiaca DW4/3-1]EAU70050.1 putative cyclase [Stigmatella aurantiaca DW4/3-1]